MIMKEILKHFLTYGDITQFDDAEIFDEELVIDLREEEKKEDKNINEKENVKDESNNDGKSSI